MAKESVINRLVSALTAKFEEKNNKVTRSTGWNDTVSDNSYPSEALVKTELDTKEITSNKINSWSNEASSTKYPTEALVQSGLANKENLDNKISDWEDITANSYPTAQLVKNGLDSKLDASSVPTSTSDLTNDGESGAPFITESDIPDITIARQETAESGAAATYILQKDGSQVGAKINIPKDLLLQSASVETVGSTPDSTESAHNLSTGDSYIKLVANTVDGDNSQTPLIIPIDDIFDLQTADESTITLSNGVFSVKASGINTSQLTDGAVTAAKIASETITAGQIADNTITADKIASSLSSTWLTNENVRTISDSEIETYLYDLGTALGAPVSQGESSGE